MSRAGKITLYIISSFLILLIFVIIFRGSLISFVLKKIIAEKSGGKVELTLDSFHISLLNGYMSVEKPTLLFSDFFLDKSRNIKIEKILFEKIEIDKLDVRALIFEKDIIARHFLVDKPQFWFKEHGTEKKSDFQPEKLLKTFSENPDIFSNIRIKIENVAIRYGSINMSELIKQNTNPGLVDFTILLENFDTHPDSVINPNRILYADEFRLRLANLHKELNSGYILNVDSASFSSSQRNLLFDGISLMPGKKLAHENNIGVQVEGLAFRDIGLNQIRGIEELRLRSVVFTNGSFTNYMINDSVANYEPDTVRAVNQLIKVLFNLHLDSVYVNNFDYYYIQQGHDTLIDVKKINFLITGILIDSTVIRDLFWNLHYDDIEMSTEGMKIDHRIIPGYSLNYTGLSYSNNREAFRLTGLQIKSAEPDTAQNPTRLNISDIMVNGLSIKDLQKRKKQHLSIAINHPSGNLNLSKLTAKHEGTKTSFIFPGYLYLDEINLKDGNFQFVKDNTLDAEINGLNILLKGLHLPETENDKLRLKRVSAQYDNIKGSLPAKSLHLTTGPMIYELGNMQLKQVNITRKAAEMNGKLHLKAIDITGLDRKKLMYDKELHVTGITLNSPDLSGYFAIPGNFTDKQKKSSKNSTFPFTFSLDSVIVHNGVLNVSSTYKEKPLQIKVSYNLALGPLAGQKNDSLNTLIDSVVWQFGLHNLVADLAGQHLKLKKFITNTYASELQLENLHISSSHSETDSSRFNIRTIELPLLEVKGLDYGLLLHDDSIDFGSLYINKPYFDITIPVEKDSTRKLKNQKLFEPDDYLIFRYDSVIIDNLNLIVERKNHLQNESFTLKDLNFSHLKNYDQADNLIEDLIFNFEQFSFYDSLSNDFLDIYQGLLDRDKQMLTIQEVKGSTLGIPQADMKTEKPGMRFTTHDITLSDLQIKESLPTRIAINKLEVKDFEMDLVQKSSDTTKEFDLRTNLDLLNRFDNLLMRLQVDTAVFNDIGFKIYTINDTAKRMMNIDSIGIIIEKIQIDTSMSEMEKPAFIEGITIDLKGKTEISKDSLYELETGKLHYNFVEQKITIDSFYLRPLFAPDEFFKRAKYQTDRIDLFGRKLEVNDIDLKELLSENHLHISSIDLHTIHLEMFRDKHYPLKPDLYKPLPRELLHNIKRQFTVDSVHITNSYLKYLEMGAKADEPGKVFFDNFNVTAYNLTNVLKEGEKKELIVNLHARIMGQTPMHLDISFPLYEDTLAFWMTGKTGKLDITLLNPLTTNLLGIGVVNGKGLVEIPYISATETTANGFLVFRYKKLRLLPYSRKKEKLKKGVLSPLVSFMINDLVIKSNNPKFARKPRLGQVYFKRDTQKSIVNYVWKGILSGLMSTMGFNNKAQRRERKEDKLH